MPEYFDTLLSTGQREMTDQEASVRPCVTGDEALAFAQGLLSDRQLRHLHAHADRCLACQLLLEEAVHAIGDESTPEGGAKGTWNTTFLPNTMVADRYRIVRFVARGGMGEVYEAYDCDLRERVALKTVVSTACDSPRAVEYLKREVHLAHRVSHPNVCRIFDLNTHVLEGTGTVVQFLTMEFVEGEVLGRRIRERGPLPVEQAQRVVRQLLQGLQAAHSAGILHRDFKSDNVMLRTTQDGELAPVILDFGLARALEWDVRQPTSATHHGLAGTLS
jgi:hypothetical protein